MVNAPAPAQDLLRVEPPSPCGPGSPRVDHAQGPCAGPSGICSSREGLAQQQRGPDPQCGATAAPERTCTCVADLTSWPLFSA